MLYPCASINLSALQHNLQQVRRLAPASRIMSVIKANGYGHGLLEVAEALAGSDAFAVARLDEAVQLRKAGISLPLVILEGLHSPEQFSLAASLQLTPVIHLQTQLAMLLAAKQPLPFCWLMLETGMHRLGMPAAELLQVRQQLNEAGYSDQQLGLMSHFANSDLLDDSRNQQQLAVMQTLAAQTGLPVCMANSAAVVALPDSHYQWVRPGLMLYGVSPFAERSATDLNLQPVMQLRSQIIGIQQLQAGDQVGYGGEWTASGPTRMGVVSSGYGDGYSRHLSNCGEVLVRDQRLPVLGRVSMDTICINLESCPEAQAGDEVLLWGNAELPVELLADRASTIAYELLSVLSARVHREYHHGEN